MRGTTIVGWAVAAAMTGAALRLIAQQGAGPPVIHPKEPPATLLVLCDLACTWKLDGVPRGRIDAGGSSKFKVELGEHLVAVVTEDGLDQVKVTKEVKSAGQTILDIELKPVRDARLKVADDTKHLSEMASSLLVTCDLPCSWTLDGEAKGNIDAEGSAKVKVELGQHKVVAASTDGMDKVSANAEAKAGTQTLVGIALQPVHDARLKKSQERLKDSQAVAAGQIWTDSTTQLMWPIKDNGRNVNWKQASDYCRDFPVAGHNDWRLPTMDELRSLYDPTISVPGIGDTGEVVVWHVRGNLRLSGFEWSATPAANAGEAWGLSLNTGRRFSGRMGDNIGNRALCVRNAAN